MIIIIDILVFSIFFGTNGQQQKSMRIHIKSISISNSIYFIPILIILFRLNLANHIREIINSRSNGYLNSEVGSL